MAYDHRRWRHACRRRGITPRIARRGVETGKRLGCYHRVIERAFACSLIAVRAPEKMFL
jgi:hypothetical protein